LFVVKNPLGEELNHNDTTDTTEEEMKSVEPPINADERRWFLLAFICVYRRFQYFFIPWALLASLAVDFLGFAVPLG
jgi:hypothetical protein